MSSKYPQLNVLRRRSFLNRNTDKASPWLTFSRQRRILIGHFTLLFCRGRLRNVPRFECTCIAIVRLRSRCLSRPGSRKFPIHLLFSWTPILIRKKAIDPGVLQKQCHCSNKHYENKTEKLPENKIKTYANFALVNLLLYKTPTN